MLLKKAVLVVLLAVGVCTNASARLLLLTSQESSLYSAFQQGFEVGLEPASLDHGITYSLASDYQSADLGDSGIDSGVDSGVDSGNVIIAAGVEAAKKVATLKVADTRVIYTMLPLSSYQWLQENNLLIENHQVLFVDQPSYRFVNLAQAAFPSIETLGFLHGEVSGRYVESLSQAALANKMSFNAVSLKPGREMAKIMGDLMNSSDAVLALPDPFLFNRRTVQSLLLASLRRKTPLIAYSESYVKAGALLALYSSPEQIGRHTAELVNCLMEKCSDSQQKNYPRYFSVQVNSVVARQLGFRLPPVHVLQAELEQRDIKRGE